MTTDDKHTAGGGELRKLFEAQARSLCPSCGAKDCNHAVTKVVFTPAAYTLITSQAKEIAALRGALESLLIACEEDAGIPGEYDGDDEAVGSSKLDDGAIRPMALTFGMLRRARSILASKGNEE